MQIARKLENGSRKNNRTAQKKKSDIGRIEQDTKGVRLCTQQEN